MLYVYVYVPMFMSMHVSIQVHLSLWVRKGLSLNLQLAILDSWTANLYDTGANLSTGVPDVLPHVAFTQVLGVELALPYLYIKYFNHCTSNL